MAKLLYFIAAALIVVASQAQRPDSIPLDEWMPFSPKQFSCFKRNSTGPLKLSLCMQPYTDRGIDGQICFPLSFWTGICSSEVRSADRLLSSLLEDDGETADELANWETTCHDYKDTWPICVSKEDKPKHCSLWKAIPKSVRSRLRKIAQLLH